MDERSEDNANQERAARNKPEKPRLKTDTDTGEGGTKPNDVTGTNLEELKKQEKGNDEVA